LPRKSLKPADKSIIAKKLKNAGLEDLIDKICGELGEDITSLSDPFQEEDESYVKWLSSKMLEELAK